MDTIIVAKETIEALRDSIVNVKLTPGFVLDSVINVKLNSGILPDSLHVYQTPVESTLTAKDWMPVIVSLIIGFATIVASYLIAKFQINKVEEKAKITEQIRIKKLRLHIFSWLNTIRLQIIRQALAYNQTNLFKFSNKSYGLIEPKELDIPFKEITELSKIDLGEAILKNDGTVIEDAAKLHDLHTLIGNLNSIHSEVNNFIKSQNKVIGVVREEYLKQFYHLMEFVNKDKIDRPNLKTILFNQITSDSKVQTLEKLEKDLKEDLFSNDKVYDMLLIEMINKFREELGKWKYAVHRIEKDLSGYERRTYRESYRLLYLIEYFKGEILKDEYKKKVKELIGFTVQKNFIYDLVDFNGEIFDLTDSL